MAVYGVDIGTSSCKASCFDGSSCHVVTLTDQFNSFWGNEKLMISAAYLDGENDDTLLVGQEAYNEHLLNPQWYLQEFKRKFAHKEPVIFTADAQVTIDDIYVTVLNELNEMFIKSGVVVDKLVLTYPASYSEGLINRLISDARQAGFDEIATIDEPSAAAEYYAYAQKNVSVGENVLVYDLGGGTFDTALIHLDDNGFRHLTSSLGLPDCGGADIDWLILSDMKRKILSDPSVDGEKALKIPSVLSTLNEKAVSVKHKLTSQKNVAETIMIGYSPYIYKLSRAELETMMEPLIHRTLELCRRIVYNAGVQSQNIHRILLVGGSSRMPMIPARLQTLFPAANISHNEESEFLVCCGAAVSCSGSEAEMLALRADRGDPEAMFELAQYYLDEENEEHDNKKGMYWLQQSAEKGSTVACIMLGIALHQGLFDQESDHEAAFPWLLRASEYGDAHAQDLLGDYYAEHEEFERAIKWYTKASGQGNINSQCSLGNIYLKTENYCTGISLLKRAADQNHSVAQYNLGVVYETGLGVVAADAQKSFNYYLMSAKNGDPDAQYEVGKRYYYGWAPVEENNSEAFAWISKSADQHNKKAFFILGECYEKGFGTAVNLYSAFRYYSEASEQGDMDAKAKLALWYYSGKEPVVSTDYDQAYKLSKAALEEVSGIAAYIQALCHDNGKGVKQSRSKALEYYKKAADAGRIGAMNDLAFIYFNGTHNVSKDYKKAFYYAEKAAKGGDTDSMMLLGACYDDGLGVSKNKQTALKWFEKAADGGNVLSMRRIGILYYNGEGNISKDNAIAEKWFRKAASYGDEDSIEILRTCFAPEPVLADPKIQFRRNGRFMGSGRVYYIRIDLSNASIRALKSGTSFDYTLPPGNHRVEVTFGPAFGFGDIDWSASNCILDQSIEFNKGDILLLDATTDRMDFRWLQIRGQQQS